MESYKQEFIRFLVRCDALRFGQFTLKSGRLAPYFINTGMFDTGEKIEKLGQYYAAAIKEHFGDRFDAIYGPAYKGIPLCVVAAIGLSKMGIGKGYVFNRKEAKDHGEKSALVGMKITGESDLVLVDDVITSGKAIRESLDILRQNGNPSVKGIIVSVNRQEKGTGEKSALDQVAQELGIPIFAIVTLQDIIDELFNKKIDGKVHIDDAMMAKIDAYRKEYGAT